MKNEFDKMNTFDRKELLGLIKKYTKLQKDINNECSLTDLTDRFNKLTIGRLITKEEAHGAMLYCGYVSNNCYFNINSNSPILIINGLEHKMSQNQVVNHLIFKGASEYKIELSLAVFDKVFIDYYLEHEKFMLLEDIRRWVENLYLPKI